MACWARVCSSAGVMSWLVVVVFMVGSGAAADIVGRVGWGGILVRDCCDGWAGG